MQCTVLFFAHAAEAAGVRKRELDLPPGATAGDAIDILCAAHPGLGALRSGLAVSVNERYVAPETVLEDGQTLALIPPVSGG